MIRADDRLLFIDIDGGETGTAFLQCCDQRAVLDDGRTAGIYQQCSRLHVRKIGSSNNAARVLVRFDVQADDVALLEESVATGRHFKPLGFCPGKRTFPAPAHDLHAERLADARDAAADMSERINAERVTVEPCADGRMPVPLLESFDFVRQMAHRSEDQCPCHFARSGIAAFAVVAARRYEVLLAKHDDGTHHAYRVGDGALTLVTDPPGAEVDVLRYVERDRRLVPELWRTLGPTPIVEETLPMGSYLLLLRAPGRVPVRYPVHIERAAHRDGVRPGGNDPWPIALPPAEQLLPDERCSCHGSRTFRAPPSRLDAPRVREALKEKKGKKKNKGKQKK